jgi:CheY-like chemotaxis protein
MGKKLSDIKVIGIGLMVLYAVSAAVYYQFIKVQELQTHSLIITLLFGLLFVGAFAVTLGKEWGRLLLVSVSILIGVYFLRFFVPIEDSIPISYVFMSLIVVLFFSKESTKTYFQEQKQGQWISVLVVDDDEALIKTVRPILTRRKYSVLSATSGEEGLQIVEKQKPDMVILDVILPGIKGREVCKRIKSNPLTHHIPIIFLTAKDSQDDVAAELEAGAEAHLTKPVNAKVLISTLQRVWENSRQK